MTQKKNTTQKVTHTRRTKQRNWGFLEEIGDLWKKFQIQLTISGLKFGGFEID